MNPTQSKPWHPGQRYGAALLLCALCVLLCLPLFDFPFVQPRAEPLAQLYFSDISLDMARPKHILTETAVGYRFVY